MSLIYETKYFTVESHPKPFVSREEGGHIRIFSKRKVEDRTQLQSEEATELIKLTMIVGEAMQVAMNNCGVNVVKINYEDLGNWSFKKNNKPTLHIHIFGRAKDAKIQIFPEAIKLPDRNSGFYDNFKPLSDIDIVEIKKQIQIIFKKDKYRSW